MDLNKPDDQMNQIQISMDQAQQMIENGKALERLYKSPDFQRVILGEYFEKHSTNLVMLLNQPQYKDKEEDILRDMRAISGLNEHFRTMFVSRRTAEQAIEDSEAEMARIAEEQASQTPTVAGA